MDDLQQLLERAAPDDVGPAPFDAIVRRGRRRRARARAVAVAVPVLVALLAVGATFLLPQQPERPMIDRPPTDPVPQPEIGDGDAGEVEIDPVPPAPESLVPEVGDQPTDRPDDAPTRDPDAFESGSVTVADLAVELFVVSRDSEGGPMGVTVVTPDGSRRLAASEPRFDSVRALVPDGRGGFVWQGQLQEDDAGVRPPILQVDPSGGQTVAVDPAHHAPEFAPSLVGADVARGGYLVAQQVIVSGFPRQDPDDPDVWIDGEEHQGAVISVPWDGDHAIVASDVTAWEYGVAGAMLADRLLYSSWSSVWNGLFVQTEGGDDDLVLEFDTELVGESVIAVAPGTHGGEGLALIGPLPRGEGGPAGRIVVVDLHAVGVVDEITVPGDLGDGAYAVRQLSRLGDLLLVSRTSTGGEWLAPLVLEVDTRRWAVLEDVVGQAFLSRDLSRS